MAPGCDRVFRALAGNLEPYRSAARELLDGPFALEKMLEQIDRHAAVIRSEARRDPHGRGPYGGFASRSLSGGFWHRCSPTPLGEGQ